MHIYPWQIDPPPIEHRCLEYHYTKLGRWIPHQLSIDALNITTPNLADGPLIETVSDSRPGIG